jgi:sulfatase maturation enzyme AslB (radical SAM superfamily)
LKDNTKEDGSIEDFKMRYMDIRFSNLCNMKCRTCGPELSSKWYDDQIKLWPEYDRPKFIDVNSAESFMKDLYPHLDTIDEVYFAGGEVLITPQHYEVLDYWLEKGRDNVRLRYTTNFSNLRHKSKSMFDYWKMFKDVRVAASLDTFGAKAEYSRKGTDWNDIVTNRKEMLQACPNTYFEITPTISIFSVYSLFEFHKTWVEQGLLEIDNVRINILTYPRYFSITILPKEQKEEVAEIYKQYIHWLTVSNAQPHTIKAVEGIVEHMFSADNSDLIPQLKKHITTIDNIRNESFVEIYPEFTTLWN